MIANNKVFDKPEKSELLEGLNNLPSIFALTPVNGNKAPYRKNWQHEEPVSRELIAIDIKAGKAQGYGIRTGAISNGLIAVDCDGYAAHDKAKKLANSDRPLPETWAFTSGRAGRCQYLYQVPEKYWTSITTKKFRSGVKDGDGKEQMLELRWDGCQSVLPPSVHPETGRYRWVKSPQEVPLAECPTWIIEAILNDGSEPTAIPTQNTDNDKKLWEDWSDIKWAISYLKAISFSRADNYDEWCKVGMALKSIDDSLLAEWEDWSRQSPKYKPGECAKKWNSFKRTSGNTIGIGTLAEWAKQDGWQFQFKQGNYLPKVIQVSFGSDRQSATDTSTCNLDAKSVNTLESKLVFSPDERASAINKHIDHLIHECLPESELDARINILASDFGCNPRDIEKIYRKRSQQLEAVEQRSDNQQQLEQLLQANDEKVNINYVLPKQIATPIIKIADWLSLRPECFVTTLLAGVSSLHKVGTKVDLYRQTDWSVTPNLYAGIIAEPSQMKSPIFSMMVTKPLGKLHAQAREEYQQKLKDYGIECSRWNKDSGEPKPEPPLQRIYMMDETTIEGLAALISKQPQNGVMLCPDELAGFFKSNNAYRGGKGSDEEKILSLYDGCGLKVGRVGGLKADVDETNVAIAGTIQPGVIKGLLGSCEDDNGKWARFMFCQQPLAASILPEDGASLNLTGLLASVYQFVDELPATTYHLSPEAARYLVKKRNKLESQRVEELLPGMRAVLGKTAGRIGKLALNLHVIEAAVQGEKPSEVIELETVKKATKLARFYVQQVRSLYSQFSNDEALAPYLVKVIELSAKRGWIKAVDVLRTINSKTQKAKKITAETVRSWFLELVAMGKGLTRGKGRSTEFSYEDINPTDNESRPSRPKVDNESTFENITNIGVQVESRQVDIVDQQVVTNGNQLQVGGDIDKPSPKFEPPAALNVELPQVDHSDKLDNSMEMSTLSTNPQIADYEGVTSVGNESTFESTLSAESTFGRKFKKGDKVKSHSIPDLGVGTLELYSEDWNQYLVLFGASCEYFNEADLALVEQFKVGAHVRSGNFTGTLCAKSNAGWLIDWDKPALKQYGEPPTGAIAESALKLE